MSVDPQLTAFLLGCVGGLAVELVVLHRGFERGKVPARYRKFWFWVVRLSLALVGGVFAWVYYNPVLHPVLYVHVGAATPALLMQFAATVPGAGGGAPGDEAEGT